MQSVQHRLLKTAFALTARFAARGKEENAFLKLFVSVSIMAMLVTLGGIVAMLPKGVAFSAQKFAPTFYQHRVKDVVLPQIINVATAISAIQQCQVHPSSTR